MKKNKIIKSGKIVAYALIVLGIIHEIATFSPLIENGLKCTNEATFKGMIYMSLICGGSLILSGILLISLFNLVKKEIPVRIPILIIGIFLGINGILSVFYMFYNPFAWIALILCLITFGISLKLKMDYK